MYRNQYNHWVITDKELLVLANYIIVYKAPLRKVAELTGISKSTLHNSFHKRMPYISCNVFEQLQNTFNENFDTKYIRGAISTSLKFQKIREEKNMNI